MKKLIKLLGISLLALSIVACSSTTTNTDSEEPESTVETTDAETLTVSATLDPHSKILEFAAPILKEQYNIDLDVIVLDDYYVFNKALDSGEVDANYFQHVPFFDGEVESNGYKISNVAGIHIEPFGFYSNTIKSIEDLEDNSKVVISNSIADHGRILTILEKAGLIKLADGVDALNATTSDIVENSKNLQFIEVKPELLTLAYENNEGDLVAINGNYAIQAGLNPTIDAVILEQADETNPYVNIVAVQQGHEDDAKIKALVEVLKSEDVKEFILSTWSDGSVIPAE
ncbi:MAG: methionine ABC transporter substrate-binding protein [Erysipelotrichaceae bacterium]|nr:methionine ABC transporter substrate-binding protein [Erysipelotrichaceae bacterium]